MVANARFSGLGFKLETTVEALEEARSYFEEFPTLARTAARLAINQVADRQGRKLLMDDMLSQVAWPRSYLNRDRFSVRKAYNENLEAVITARMRPTSLARFVKGQAAVSAGRGLGGVRVQVRPGTTKTMQSAFLMRLRAGASMSDTNFNLGLAIRLKPGERILNKTKQSLTQLGHNLYLLYGPSVDQVFRTVAMDRAPDVVSMVQSEFYRQFNQISERA